MMSELFRKNRNYRVLLVFAVIDRFGDSIDALAQSWLVYQVTMSSSLSALNFALNYIPTVFFQPLCGAFVTKHNQQRIIRIANYGRTLIALFLAFMVMNGNIHTWEIFLSTFLISTLEAFRLPCSTKLMADTVDQSEYAAAEAHLQTVNTITQLAGAGIAGVLIDFSMAGTLFVDAGCFFVAAVLIYLLRVRQSVINTDKKTFAIFKEGLDYIKSVQILLLISVTAALLNGAAAPSNALQSAFCAEVYHKGAEAISVMNVAISVGMIFGSLTYEKVKERISAYIALLLGFISVALIYVTWLVGILLVAYPTAFYSLIAGLSFLTGVTLVWANIALQVILVQTTAPDYLTRVSSVSSAMSTMCIPLVSFVTSALALHVPMPSIFACALVISLILGVVFADQIKKSLAESGQ